MGLKKYCQWLGGWMFRAGQRNSLKLGSGWQMTSELALSRLYGAQTQQHFCVLCPNTTKNVCFHPFSDNVSELCRDSKRLKLAHNHRKLLVYVCNKGFFDDVISLQVPGETLTSVFWEVHVRCVFVRTPQPGTLRQLSPFQCAYLDSLYP
jgi:hypothetical protein